MGSSPPGLAPRYLGLEIFWSLVIISPKNSLEKLKGVKISDMDEMEMSRRCRDELEMYEEAEFDAETQQRLDCEVDKLLKGYDWTLSPLANK